jgi:hypothetical protein
MRKTHGLTACHFPRPVSNRRPFVLPGRAAIRRAWSGG